jgi:hypothetical protein
LIATFTKSLLKAIVKKHQLIHSPAILKVCALLWLQQRITKNHEVEHPYIEAIIKE